MDPRRSHRVARLCCAIGRLWWCWWAMAEGSRILVIDNQCKETVWPGVLTGAGTAPLSDDETGFELGPGSKRQVNVSENWSGRVWARTGCGGGAANFSCQTADCGTKAVECRGLTAAPPATLVEMTLNGSDGKDFYDISLVDGFNLGASVVPSNDSCEPVICAADISSSCPTELSVLGSSGNGSGEKSTSVVVACKSACLAFDTPSYCCSGNYSSPALCKPSSFSLFFKSQCPSAYSYAYDDASSTFTCPASSALLYTITFCPPPSSSSSWSSSSSRSRIKRQLMISSYMGFLFLLHNIL